MYISQHNVYDALSDIPFESRIHDDRVFRFHWVSLVTPGDQLSDPARLYVCEPNSLRTAVCEDPDSICILCTGDLEEIHSCAGARFPNLIAVPGQSSIKILNLLQSAFAELLQWSYQVNSDIAKQSEFQTIIERGRSVFGEKPLLLVNSSYNILAASTTNAGGSANLQQVLDQGYYSKDTTDVLAKMGYFKHSYRYTKPTLLDTPNFMKAPLLIAAIYSNRHFCGFIALYFTDGSRPTVGQTGLFTWFSQKLRDYYLRCIDIEHPVRTQKDAFINDLLQHTKQDEQYLEDRARALQIPLDMHYRVCVISWENYSQPQAGYVMWRLINILGFPSYRIFSYQNMLVLLMNGDLSAITVQEKAQYSSAVIRDLLEADGGYAGFSLPGFHLFNINTAFRQALAAASLGLRLAPDEKLYFYSKYYVYDLFSCYENESSLDDMCFWRIRELKSADGDDYDDYHLLYTFLMTERSITQTAQLMHMHRNSVIYRLKRIRSEYLIDLDDPDVRLRLMLSFRMREYLENKRENRIPVTPSAEHEDPLFLE